MTVAACSGYFLPPDIDLQASRLWHDVTIEHGLPVGAEAVTLDLAAVSLPMLRQGGRLRALTTPYTLAWRPLCRVGATPAGIRSAGRELARRIRWRPPLVLDALAPDAPGLGDLLAGVSAAGCVAMPFAHFGNWHEALADSTDWSGYLAARPPALRNTIQRKQARAARDTQFHLVSAPGPALDGAIASYRHIHLRSWKPEEPAPGFDPALMRALAPLGLLRLGILSDMAGLPIAAQYWALDQEGRRATVLKLSHVETARALSPGTVLTALMVRHLLDVDGVGELDFGRGDDAYKRQWVGQRRQRIGVVIASPLHPAGVVAIARHAVGRVLRTIKGE